MFISQQTFNIGKPNKKKWHCIHDDGRTCTVTACNSRLALDAALAVFVEYDQNKVSVEEK